MKYLIINADDFGYSQVFNESILNLIENDFISSTTVMVNWITTEQKKQVNKLIKLKKPHKVSIGLHLELNEPNILEEIQKQYDKFIKIFNFEPSHIDVHKPSKSKEEKIQIKKFCKKHNLPCRNLNVEMENITTTNELLNGTDMKLEDLIAWIKTLKENKFYEILFHPGTYDINCKSSLNIQRELDVIKIKKIYPKLAENQIKLINYIELKTFLS